MSFTVREFRDLIRILEEHPEWREELRRQVLSEELLRLPEELAAFRAEARERMDRLEQALIALTARVEELTARVDALTARVDELAQAQRRTEERMDRLEQALITLTARVDALTARVDELAQVQKGMLIDLGHLKGRDKERQYREKAHAYFGRHLAHLRVLGGDALARMLEPEVERGVISLEEYLGIMEADLVARGRWRGTGEEVYLLVEVSWGVGPSDVERALARASYLAKTGRRVVAGVAGEEALPQVEREAIEKGVVVATDGRVCWPGDA